MAQSKLELSGARTEVSAEDAGALVCGILQAKGCIPRERERDAKAASGGMIAVPDATWAQIVALGEACGFSA